MKKEVVGVPVKPLNLLCMQLLNGDVGMLCQKAQNPVLVALLGSIGIISTADLDHKPVHQIMMPGRDISELSMLRLDIFRRTIGLHHRLACQGGMLWFESVRCHHQIIPWHRLKSLAA